jgi:PAS domain S-box-containing protein
VSLNPAFEAITGWSRVEWLGRRVEDLMHPSDRSRASRSFSEMIQQSHSSTMSLRLDGRVRLVPVEVVSFPRMVDGVVTEIYGFARDRTLTLRATEERERVMRNLQLLLDSTVEGIYTLDQSGRCTMVNRAAAALLDRSAEELIGVSMDDLLHAHDDRETRDQCAVLRAIHSGESCSTSSDVFWRKDGTPIPVSYSAAPIVDAGVQIGVVVTFTDLTERRKLEARLEQANRLSSLGRLAATVAHEFNNVLMGIAPFVELVRRAPSPQKMTSSLDHIANSVKRGRRITEDILRFTQPAEPVRTTVVLNDWLHDVAVEARSILPSHIEIDVDAEPLAVEADANQLHQILSNLLLNARDAMPHRGTITVRAIRDAEDARYPFGALENPNRYAHLMVRDTGCGMSEETLRHAFEPLFTTKKNGTGLGLAVTHQVVLRHGGEIFIESALGDGTTFHLFLPLVAFPEENCLAVETSVHERIRSGPPRHVLLVEDDPAVAVGLTALLQHEGFVITHAATGGHALKVLESLTADAVLLDVGLPDMDGAVVYQSICERFPSLGVIFSTGHGDRARLDEALSRPNVRFLLKPYEADELIDALLCVMAVRETENGAL